MRFLLILSYGADYETETYYTEHDSIDDCMSEVNNKKDRDNFEFIGCYMFSAQFNLLPFEKVTEYRFEPMK